MTMIGLGSIVNAAAIVAGGCVGLVAGKAISERTRATLVSGMAVGTLFVGFYFFCMSGLPAFHA